eukprot:PhF_6_TR34713/c0_g1_i1/m.50516
MSFVWEVVQADNNLLCNSRSAHTCIVCNGSCLVLFGGAADDTADIDIFDTACSTWIRIPSQPAPRNLIGHTACVVGEYMVVFGGYLSTDVVVDTLWGLHLPRMNWTAIPIEGDVKPTARHGHSAVCIPSPDQCSPSGMVIIGGCDENDELLGDMWVFDTDTRQWLCLIEFHQGLLRAYHAAHARQVGATSQIFLIGGTEVFYCHFALVDIISHREINVVAVECDGPSVPRTPWFGHATFPSACGRSIVCMDGTTSVVGGDTIAHITSVAWPETDEHRTMAWCEPFDSIGFFPTKRRGHSGCVVKDRVYVFGGRKSNGFVANDMFVTKHEHIPKPQMDGSEEWSGVTKCGVEMTRGSLCDSSAKDTMEYAPVMCSKRIL